MARTDDEGPGAVVAGVAAENDDASLTAERTTVALSIVTLLVGTYFVVAADFPASSQRAPVVVGSVCIALSLFVLVKYARTIVRSTGEFFPAGSSGRGGRLAPFVHAGGGMAVLTTAYFATLGRVDFYLASGTFVVAASYFLAKRPSDPRRLLPFLLFGIAVPLVVYILFDWLLSIRLPR